MQNLTPAPVQPPFQIDLPMQPPDSIRISDQFAMQTLDGITTYFHNLVPFDTHPADDRNSRGLRIAKLHVLNGVSQSDLARAFHINRRSITRIVKRYHEDGDKAFRKDRLPRSRTVFDEDMIFRTREKLALGVGGPTIARELGVPISTFYENRRAGVFGVEYVPTSGKEPKSENPQEMVASKSEAGKETGPVSEASRPADRDVGDKQTVMGRATHDVPGRQAAARGLMTAATPSFDTPHEAVAHGGVLTALPMLLAEGLLSPVTRTFRLPDGFYGVSTLLLMLAFLVLARVRSPEQLRYQSPGEWGCLLGLDRSPEVKTLRTKSKLLSAEGDRVSEWQRELAGQWLRPSEEVALTLAVDGHVKVYDGKGNVPKNYVARQKLCLPATVGYWVNQLDGAPVMCLHQELNPGMTAFLEHQLIPELRTLGVIGEDAPDLTRPGAGEPAVTLVFDREGWSPDLFRRLARCGVAVITWHKRFRGEDWAEECFAAVEVTIRGPAEGTRQTVQLAEGTVRLNNGLEVRQIRRRLDGGRQVPLVTTHPGRSMADLAGAMFSRWSQENFFRYLRQEFSLDLYPTHDLEEVDPEAEVVNPAWRELEKEQRRARMQLDRALSRARQHPDDASHAAEVEQRKVRLEEIRSQKKPVPKKVKAGELAEPLQALPIPDRLFIDLIRMIGYRAETRMVGPLLEQQGEGPKRNHRKLLKGLLTSSANLIPEPDRGILRVQVLGLGNDAMDKALEPLFQALNETRTVYPGTNLTLVYEANGNPNTVTG